MVFLTLLAGCGKKEDVVVTINDEEIYLSETMYYIYYTELELGLSSIANIGIQLMKAILIQI